MSRTVSRSDARLDRMAVVYAMADAVSRAAGVDQVYEEAISGLLYVLDADRAAVLLADDDGVMRFKASRGLSQRYRAAVEGHSPWSPDDPDPRPLAVDDVSEDPAWADYLPVFRQEGIAALAFITLIYESRLVGKFMVYYDRPHAFETDELRLAWTIASHVAFTIGRARAAAERERLLEHQRLLARAGRVLSTSLDVETTLRNLAQVCIGALGDWCLVVVEEEGGIRRLASARASHIPADVADALERQSVPLESDVPVAWAIRQERALLIPELTEQSMGGWAPPGSEIGRLLRRLGPLSVIVVPLRAGERAIGALALIGTDGRRFGEHELRLAEDLADRASLAAHNAVLFQEAQEANAAKARFLGVLSHEFRTPLSAILGYVDLLLTGVRGELDEPQRLDLERVKLSVRHMANLVDEILSFARMEAGREQVRPERVELVELCRDAASLVEPVARVAELGFVVRLPEPPVQIVTDPSKLRQILLNLLSNAVKYTPRGSVTMDVEAGAETINVTVRDTGRGIPAAELPRIFEPFYRSDAATASGTGLGLSVARHLAELLGGTLTARSEPGRGSTFSLVLPVQKPTGRTLAPTVGD